MGSFDGAETCELIGLYILSQIQHLGINVGLYRDDGLAVCNKSPRQIELLKKELCKIFAKNKLKITIEANLKTVDFLDITMDLRSGIFKPYMKPNNTPLYVHKESNHPPNIIKNIPESINRRLSNISSDENIFNAAAPTYQRALKQSGYKYTLKYKPDQNIDNARQKRSRKRKITWFNPPYSENVATNVGKKFLNLVKKSFPPGHKLHKLLNQNSIKLSYSCMPNVKQIISAHNSSVTKKNNNQDSNKKTCNCRNKKECPLDNKCLTEGIIYQATVTRQDGEKEETYVGLTENTFKIRYGEHKNSFTNKKKRNATTLSSYIWTLEDNKIPFQIKWKILAKGKPFSTSSKICNLCLKEKYFIICRPNMASLNNRNELASECRHKKKHLLCSIN